MLRPRTSRRERILVMGPYGSGKTSAWLSIAKWSQTTGSSSRFFVIDTENTLEAMLDQGSQYAALTNIEAAAVYDYETYLSALDRYAKTATPDDWCVTDVIGLLWDMTQEEYIE